MPSDHGDEIIHREMDTEQDNPAEEIPLIVAELEETEISELATAWSCIDDVLAHVFSNPPSPEAQVEITFSYEGYRITVQQNGTAKFVDME